MLEFLDGLRAERLGRIDNAMSAYRYSLQISTQANTLFNLARLELELEQTASALAHLKAYLDVAPKKAPDRGAIEQLIKQLESADPVVTIGAGSKAAARDAEPLAFVLLDGVVVGQSPVTLSVKPGTHVAERVTSTTYGHRRFEVSAGDHDYVPVSAERDQDGAANILFATGDGEKWQWEWKTKWGITRLARRTKLPPGHYSLEGRGEQFDTCQPIVFDVAAGSHVSVVRIELGPEPEDNVDKRCREVRNVTVQNLEVAP